MHLVTANVSSERVDEVTGGLRALGVARSRFAEVSGYVEGREAEVVWRGCLMRLPLVKEHELEAVALIVKIAREAPRGDGFVCVTPVEQCYRIATGHPQLS